MEGQRHRWDSFLDARLDFPREINLAQARFLD
jgi:hypothetical protein